MALVLALGVVVAGEAVQLGVELLKGAGRVGAQPGGCRLVGALDLALGLRVRVSDCLCEGCDLSLEEMRL